jgi:hypothetical protein
VGALQGIKSEQARQLVFRSLQRQYGNGFAAQVAGKYSGATTARSQGSSTVQRAPETSTGEETKPAATPATPTPGPLNEPPALPKYMSSGGRESIKPASLTGGEGMVLEAMLGSDTPQQQRNAGGSVTSTTNYSRNQAAYGSGAEMNSSGNATFNPKAANNPSGLTGTYSEHSRKTLPGENYSQTYDDTNSEKKNYTQQGDKILVSTEGQTSKNYSGSNVTFTDFSNKAYSKDKGELPTRFEKTNSTKVYGSYQEAESDKSSKNQTYQGNLNAPGEAKPLSESSNSSSQKSTFVTNATETDKKTVYQGDVYSGGRTDVTSTTRALTGTRQEHLKTSEAVNNAPVVGSSTPGAEGAAKYQLQTGRANSTRTEETTKATHGKESVSTNASSVDGWGFNQSNSKQTFNGSQVSYQKTTTDNRGSDRAPQAKPVGEGTLYSDRSSSEKVTGELLLGHNPANKTEDYGRVVAGSWTMDSEADTITDRNASKNGSHTAGAGIRGDFKKTAKFAGGLITSTTTGNAALGAQYTADGTAKAGLDGVDVRGGLSGKAGVFGEIKNSNKIGDYGQVDLSAEALAGARGSLQGQATIADGQVALGANASAFVGGEIGGKASGTLGYKGRNFLTAQGNISGSAGLGGSANANFKFDAKTGTLTMGWGLSGTVGLGLGGGTQVTVNLKEAIAAAGVASTDAITATPQVKAFLDEASQWGGKYTVKAEDAVRYYSRVLYTKYMGDSTP